MDQIKQFKLYMLQKGIASSTANRNAEAIRYLFKTLPVINKENLEQFFSNHLEKGGSTAYLNSNICALKYWGRFIGEPDLGEFKFFKIKPTHKATLSDVEIESFLNLPRPYKHNEECYKTATLFFKTLAYSGMRPGEVAELTVESLDFGRQVFILERTKTTPRLVPIAPTLIDDLTELVAKSKDTLFLIRGKKFNKSMWAHYFWDRIKRLGIKRKRLSVYSLRHSFITRLLDEDVNIFKVQKIVGHNQITTTALYTHLTTKDITRAINKDPLSRGSLPFYDRLKLFREGVTRLLEDFATSPEEEKNLLASL